MCKSGPPADGPNLQVSFYPGRRLAGQFCMQCSIRTAGSWYNVTKNLYPDPRLTAVKGQYLLSALRQSLKFCLNLSLGRHYLYSSPRHIRFKRYVSTFCFALENAQERESRQCQNILTNVFIAEYYLVCLQQFLVAKVNDNNFNRKFREATCMLNYLVKHLFIKSCSCYIGQHNLQFYSRKMFQCIHVTIVIYVIGRIKVNWRILTNIEDSCISRPPTSELR